MIYKDSVMIVRTKRNTTVGCHAIATNNYLAKKPDEFANWDGLITGESFTFTENGYGDIIVTVLDGTHDKKTPITHTVTILNVTAIEIRTHYIS